MGIKKDALELLINLYNDKIDGIKFDLDKVSNHLGFSETRFKNAYQYLVERGLIQKGRSFMGKTDTGLPIIEGVEITSSGIDAIEEDEVLKSNFGHLEINFTQQGKVNIINQSGDKNPSKINAPYVEKPTYQNVGEITYGSKYQNVTDSATYNGDVRNIFLLEKSSIFFINLLGEKKVKYIGLLSTILGIIDVIGWIVSITNRIIPMTYNGYTFYVVGLGIILIIIGIIFLKMHSYKIQSKCSKCNKDYSMQEFKDPNVKEVETSEGVRKTTTRFYKCKYCGYEDTDVEKELIPYEE